MNIYLLNYLNFILLNNHNKYNLLIIYNKNRFIVIKVLNIHYKKSSKILRINEYEYLTVNTSDNCLSFFIQNWNNFFIRKIKFKGKGYKIIKKKRCLFLSFNHSHITWLLTFRTLCKRLTKQKYILVGKKFTYLSNTINLIYKIRPINIYTRRGIRIGKQKILKRIGKKTN